MTLWEWSIAATVLGPVLAVIAMWFLAQKQAQAVSAAFFLLTGVAGMIASGYGIVAVEAFVLPTDVFFAMVATFDKFSAMFFFPFAAIVAALGLRWYGQRETVQRTSLQVIGAAALVAGVTWALLSTNILGLVAALFLVVCGEVCLSSVTARLVVLRSVGVLSIATGFFILSSGALFNDFATLTYIAAELDPTRFISAFSALFLGVVILSGGWPFSRAVCRRESTVPAGAERALVRSTYAVVPLYIFIRALLFILPPLTLWFAVSVSVVGVLTILSATHYASQRRAFADTSFVFGAGVALFMLSSAMAFQTLEMFEAMNIALFATLIHIVATVLSGGAEEHAPKTGVVERAAMHVAILALPPSIIFVSLWMFVSNVAVERGSLPRALAVWFTIGTVFLLAAFVRRGSAAIADLRSVLVHRDMSTPFTRDFSFILLVALAALGGLFVPFVLSAIGAGPLTVGAEAWHGAVVVRDSMLSVATLLIGLVALSAGFWLLRDKASAVVVHDAAEEPGVVEFAESRFAVLRREMYKIAVQRMAVPGLERVKRIQAWHEVRASKPVSPTMGLMLLAVILTLAIAL
jgi:formate hydrogenlyase subunit 3/multisubunit Na+/H+ antiporter MnhD subunit